MRTSGGTSSSDFFKRYGGWLIVAVVCFSSRAAASSSGNSTRCSAPQKKSKSSREIYKDVGSGKIGKAPQQLDDLSKSGSKAVRASASFTRAALAIQQNDTKLAIATYKCDRRG